MQRVNTRRRTETVHGTENATVARLSKVLLLVGGLAFLGGLLSAHTNPATGYELSIYRSTPAFFWIGIGVAVACSLLVGFVFRPDGLLHYAAMFVGGIAILSIVSLPLIRGYYFYGMGDSLTHLGWVRDLAAGALEPTRFLYPGIHATTLLVESFTGLTLRRTMQLVVVVFTLVYFVFVPLCVGTLVDGRGASAVAAFAGLLLLPANDLGVFLMAHPFTQALFFTPLLLYLGLRHVLDAPGDEELLPFTATGATLAFTSVALILLHPQQAVNVAILFLLMGATRWAVLRWNDDHPIASQRSVLAHGAFIGAACLLWTSRLERAQDSATGVVDSFLRHILSDAGSTTSEAAQAASVSALGGSIPELVLKLFLPTLVFGIFAGGLVFRALLAETRGDASRRSVVVVSLAVAAAALTGMFVVFYFASSTAVWGRYVGAVVVLVTILGCVGLVRGREWASTRVSDVGVDGALALVFAVLVVLSAMTFFMSPFVYLSSSQVAQTEMVGYQSSFEHLGSNATLLGVRLGPVRFSDAVYGPERKPAMSSLARPGTVPPKVFNSNVTTNYDGENAYLVVKRSDVQRELGLYRGLRYHQSGFERVNSSADVSLVQTTGHYRMYRL